jgi:hypothetical protein
MMPDGAQSAAPPIQQRRRPVAGPAATAASPRPMSAAGTRPLLAGGGQTGAAGGGRALAKGGGGAGGGALAVRARRAWKRLAESRSRPAVMLHAVVRAFKMGVYFKVLVTAVLVLRLASHSAQMQFPAGAIAVDEHARLVRQEAAVAVVQGGGVRERSLRVVVLGTSGEASGLHSLLLSLDAARYEENSGSEGRWRGQRQGRRPVEVSLDVWLFARSAANAVPVLFLPLAIAVFGPPRFDHAAAAVARDFKWRHGPKHVVAQRSEPDWAAVWAPSAAAANETVLLLDATRARAVAPTFFAWLSRARVARPDVAAYALDGVAFSPDRGGDVAMGNTVVTEALLPATAALSPTRDAWIAFLRWRRLRSRHFWAHPSLPRAIRVGGYDWWDALRVDPTRAWFAQFAYEYQARIIHPVLPDRQVLVVRKPGCTDGAAGAGLASSVRLSVDAEVRINAHTGEEGEDGLAFAPPDTLTVLKWGGTRANVSSMFGELIDDAHGDDEADTAMDGRLAIVAASRGDRTLLARIRRTGPHVISEYERVRRVSVRDLVAGPANGGAARTIDTAHAALVQQLVDHAREHGRGTLALAAVRSDDDLDAAYSWLCNVETLRIAPPALALVVRDNHVAMRLQHFAQGLTGWHSRTAPLVLALHTGRPELEAAIAARDVLDRGVAVVRFSVRQVWLSDPMFYVSAALSTSSFDGGDEDGMLSSVDAVIARNSKGEASASFLVLQPTFTGRFLWSEVVSMMAAEVLRHGSLPPRLEQRVLSGILFSTDRWHARRFPPPRWLALNSDLFVDSLWYNGFDASGGEIDLGHTPYENDASRRPVLTNLAVQAEGGIELDDDILAWKRRARSARHWFVSGDMVCDAELVHDKLK